MATNHTHNHTHCAHQFVHCLQCDVVYCKVCSEEWGKNTKYTWTTSPTYTYPNTTYTAGLGEAINCESHCSR